MSFVSPINLKFILPLQDEKKPVQMMFKKSKFKTTYIGGIFTKILLLPYVGSELNMIIMLTDEHIELSTVRISGPQWSCGGERAVFGFLLGKAS